MITEVDLVWIMPVGGRTPLDGPMARARGEHWMECYRRRGNRGPAVYELVAVPWCQVCGEIGNVAHQMVGQHMRCAKHVGRNPCLVEGCKRSTAGRRYSLDSYLCPEHWRAFVPPGSAERKIYNRFFRRWKRYGETDESIRAFWRFWRRLVSRARARGRGDLDVAEINRIMGW